MNGISQVTNLPWVLDERKRARAGGSARVADERSGSGGHRLHPPRPGARTCFPRDGPPRVATLRPPSPRAPGSARPSWVAGDHYVPCQPEGGHADFGTHVRARGQSLPLLETTPCHHAGRLRARALSGPGLGNVYEFFRRRNIKGPAKRKRASRSGNRNAKNLHVGPCREKPGCKPCNQIFLPRSMAPSRAT